MKSKSEEFWGKILQPNASTVKITKQLPKTYSLRYLQQHSRALVMPDRVIYIQHYRCSWWVHCLSQELENWIQINLPNPTFYTNSAELKSQSNAYIISKRLNMLHLLQQIREQSFCAQATASYTPHIHTCCITSAKGVSSTSNTCDVTNTCH